MVKNKAQQDNSQCELGTPVISVILPVYNCEKYLAVAIESILSQTYTNFELIIINDGSTDDSQKILDSYKTRDSRIRVISRANKGLANTLNQSIDLARGKWIARMDQDDISFPNRLERQVKILEETNADVCGSWVKFFGKGRSKVWKGLQSDQEIKKDMLFKSPFVHPSVMFKSDVIREFRYDSNFENAEDYDLWVRLAISGKVMINVPEVLLMYRKHGDQVSNKLSNRQKLLGMVIQKRYWLFLSELYELELCEIEAILGFINNEKQTNMNLVLKGFIKILRLNIKEARRVYLQNIFIISLRAAYEARPVITFWVKLNRMFAHHFPINRLMLLLFVKQVGVLGNLIKSK